MAEALQAKLSSVDIGLCSHDRILNVPQSQRLMQIASSIMRLMNVLVRQGP